MIHTRGGNLAPPDGVEPSQPGFVVPALVSASGGEKLAEGVRVELTRACPNRVRAGGRRQLSAGPSVKLVPGVGVEPTQREAGGLQPLGLTSVRCPDWPTREVSSLRTPAFQAGACTSQLLVDEVGAPAPTCTVPFGLRNRCAAINASGAGGRYRGRTCKGISLDRLAGGCRRRLSA